MIPLNYFLTIFIDYGVNKAFSLLYIALPIRKNTNETQKGYKWGEFIVLYQQ